MVTVLDKLTSKDFALATLLSQLQGNFEAKAAVRTSEVEAQFGQQLGSIEVEKRPWERVQEKAGEASSQFADVVGRVKNIRSSLDGMISRIVKAEQVSTGDTNWAGYAAVFDSLLAGFVNLAEDGTAPNLLGVAEPKLTYEISPTGATTSVQGAHLGSDYYIVDSEGKWWVPDRDARNLKRYDEFPDMPANEAGAFENGLQLDSLVGDAITFTVGPDTGSPTQYTGTIFRDDLQVVDSWFYDGLETQDGRDRAIAALNAAKEAVDLELTRYEVTQSVAIFYEQRAIQTLEGLTKESNDLLIEQAIEIQKAQDELTRQFTAATNSITLAISQQVNYTELFAPFINERFSAAFIDLTA